MDKNNELRFCHTIGIREGLEYFSERYNTVRACTASDKSPRKLMPLSLPSLKATTPELLLDAYNSLVDAYNKAMEAKPVGEWVYEDKVVGKRYYRCSNCPGMETLADEEEVNWWRFCPRCGSKMFTKDKNKEEE